MLNQSNTKNTMITQHEPYTATQRYFRACDLLDHAEHNGGSPKRIARRREIHQNALFIVEHCFGGGRTTLRLGWRESW